MSESVFMFEAEDPAMQRASEDARQSFKYFWRELSWERRRIIPGLGLSMVKLPFTDGPRTDGNPAVEHMWVTDIDFDGASILGTLANSPNWLTSMREGSEVRRPLSELGDWLLTCNGRAYGGYTVNAMRAKMARQERQQHDDAWGLDFGDPAVVRVEIESEGKPKGGFLSGLFGGGTKKASEPPTGFKDHPMCVNMLEKIEAQLKADPSIARSVNEGWTMLHTDALAGNFGVVKLLVRYGADVAARTPAGRTAADLARSIGWPEIADYLDASPKA